MIGERIRHVLVRPREALWPDFIVVTSDATYLIEGLDLVRIVRPSGDDLDTLPEAFRDQRIVEVRTNDEVAVVIKLESGALIVIDSTFAASIDDVVRTADYQTEAEAAEWQDQYRGYRIIE